MDINLKRTIRTGLSTIGELSIDGSLYCNTLERPEVQIDPGTYSVEMTYSPRFNRPLPLLDSVPDRSDIRIHAGNLPGDTEGCILVGLQKGNDMILQSRLALDPLVERISSAIASGEKVTITVS